MKTILTALTFLLTTSLFGQSTILTENFGNPSNTITCSSYDKWQNISNYKYKTSDVSPEIKADYKSGGYINASGGGNLSFEGGTNQYLDITGINTMGYAYLAVSFYVIEVGGEVSGDEISVLVSDNGGEFKELNLGNDAIGTSYSRRLIENGIPNSKNLAIRIVYTPSNKGVKIRIDDLKLLGCFTPSVPSVTYEPTACLFEVINLPSNTFIQTAPNGTDVNPVGVILSSGNYYLRTVSTTMGCSSVWSEPVKFYVQVSKMPKITKHPTSSISVFNKATEYNFTANADTTFLWEVSKNNGVTWEEIENTPPYRINGDTLSIRFTDEVKKFNGYQYRITTYGSACKVSSTAGTLFIPDTSNDNIVYFNADKFFTVINITWVTYKEKNLEEFVIERADSKMKWEKIGALTAMHNTDGRYGYSFYDNYPISNSLYYRIKVVKEDNTTLYTPIIAVIKNTDGTPNKQYYSLLGEVVSQLQKDKYYIVVVDGTATRVVLSK